MALEAKVDLNDPPSASAAKKDPLITILASHAKGYRIGFLYSVNYGGHEINFWHKILAPKEFSMFYSRKIGIRSVSPMGVLSDAHSITEFIYDRGAYIPNHERASPGQYTVKSHVHVGGTKSTLEDVGEITWRINIV
ncbi:hypothetical protein M407DRAFT_196066 [Tulasnella calospora MUT 4182]|uniref:Uncharacterized protein n=1 Tax=Tulasnella calospora MUT 4182 TaxID=1051891 RepID=A0A0C3K3R3_9AGAM|nr:hypothetical protein M407DRAFT_196066 [Tulasnella calospora MUT 4182]